MEDEKKNEYDAWTCLRDHVWCEFEEKTRLEWRLSFGIWVALLSSAGAVLSADQLKGSILFIILTCLVIIVVAYLHARFLGWIQSSLRKSRDIQREAETKMRALLHLAPLTLGTRKQTWQQPSLQVQMLITILVSITLLLVVLALPNG